MRPLTAAELSRMRQTQAAAHHDTCVLLRRTAGLDAWGYEAAGETATDPVPCGFDPTSAGKREYRRADGTVAVVQATLRLSIADGEALQATDQVRITHRHGEPLPTPLVFGLDGPPERGATGVVLRLVAVE